MKNISFQVIALACSMFWLSNCQQQPQLDQTTATATPTQADLVQRGQYLVNMLGCDDCHTPKNMTQQGPAPDMTRRFMGHPAAEPFAMDQAKKDMITSQFVAIFSPSMTAVAGPWGVSFAANISPDDTGIGNWTEAQFMKAIREGKSKGLDGTRPLLPPMPWQMYRNMTDEDLKSVFAYLKSMKPVQNVVPQPLTM
ncbi:MAG: c-type cytochrome [Saprospiraceae bacterium]|nr:c-type cytochrome [Saprospiraceae bacterium]